MCHDHWIQTQMTLMSRSKRHLTMSAVIGWTRLLGTSMRTRWSTFGTSKMLPVWCGTRMPLSGIAWLEGWTSVAPMPGMWRARAPATQPAAPAAHHGIGPRPWSRALDWQLRGRGSQVASCDPGVVALLPRLAARF